MANKPAPAFLFGDSMLYRSKQSFHYLVEAFIISHDANHCICSMFWHDDVCTLCSSLFHVIHFLILKTPMHTHNTHSTWAVSPSQVIQVLYNGTQMSLTATLYYSTLWKKLMRHMHQTCVHKKKLSAHSWNLCIKKEHNYCHSLAYVLHCIYHAS